MEAHKLLSIAALTVFGSLTACLDTPEGTEPDTARRATPADEVAAITDELAALELESLPDAEVNSKLGRVLKRLGFTGRIEATLEDRLQRPVDPALADLGRVLWFDKIGGLHDDNTCGGCHAPSAAFGDTQSIAIGVQSNNRVGPNRAGPRNQRRTPSVINNAFFPKLMWNGRFAALSGDPFDNSAGFEFPAPEGTVRFPANDPRVTHLLIAQGHIPPTELVEMAGFTGTAGTISPTFDPFDDGLGQLVPAPDASGFRNEPIRDAVAARLDASPAYRARFAQVFPTVAAGGPIDITMYAEAVSEFELSLTFANAPIDRFARGNQGAMTRDQKLGALVFFGKGRCVQCHAVSGDSNEMFSDFENRVAGIPQIAPAPVGVGIANVIFDGPGQDEDFGAEQISGDPADRYKFRTSPLRNVGLQPAFFHNGAYTRLDDAIAHHLNAVAVAPGYSASAAGVDSDLNRVGPIAPVLQRIDPLLAAPVALTNSEFNQLVAFVRHALTDPRARKQQLCPLVPANVPSGAPGFVFEGC